MISIDRVYKTVRAIANTDIRGNVTPAEIRLFINQAVNDIYNSYFSDISRAINRENRGLISVDISSLSSKIGEKIDHFLKESGLLVTDGLIQLPDDLRFLDSIYLDDYRIDLLKNTREFKTVKPYASTTYPIARLKGREIEVYPLINDTISISYLRNVTVANWTYAIINNTEVFNPSSPQFRDIDLHPSEESNLIIETLKLCGINLKEKDLEGFAYREDNREFNEENTN